MKCGDAGSRLDENEIKQNGTRCGDTHPSTREQGQSGIAQFK